MSSLPLCLASTSATRSSTSVRRVVLSSARRTLATTETSSPQSALSSPSTIRPQPRPAPAPLSSTPMTTFFHPALDPPLLNNPEQALSDSSPLGSLRRLPVDMQDFLRGYPNFMRNRWHQTNAQFFAGKVPAEPRGMLIEELLEDLERNPRSYQRDAFAASWLAPIVERNANRSGWCLQPHEVEAITQSPIQLNRYERGIRLLLRSYGIELVDMQTGLFRPYVNFANDFQHILAHPSSLLTLTRILKSLDSFYATDHFGRAPYSRLHLVPSLVLFLVAQHNAGAIDLSPNTHAGRELEERWTFCLKQRVAREVIQGIVASRRGTEGYHSTESAATEGEAPMEEGGNRWTIAAYEQWCITRVAQAPSTTSTSRPVAPSDKITTLPVTTLSDAVRRGRWEHLVDRHWRADPLWRAENGLLRLEAAEESARRGAVDPDGGWWEVKKDAEEDETAEAKDEMDREVAFEPLVFRAGEIAGVEVGRGEREKRMQEAIGRSLSLEEDQWEEEHEEGEEEEQIARERR